MDTGLEEEAVAKQYVDPELIPSASLPILRTGLIDDTTGVPTSQSELLGLDRGERHTTEYCDGQ